MSNNFEKIDGEIDWVRYCTILEESDVAAFGITDYFQLDDYFVFKANFDPLFPFSEKVFFPVVEVRLNESVNGKREDVNLHILFRPDELEETIKEFLGALKTELTGPGDKKLSCAELPHDKLDSATVTRQGIQDAYESVFGKTPQADKILILVPSNNDGIRADPSNKRKQNIADQIDKIANAIFGNSTNSSWFLDKNRYEKGNGPSRPKPVFGGSDAHNFSDLVAWLGKPAGAPNEKLVTWVKADPTYEGLQQTLVEPEERVRLTPAKPDFKEPYRYIKKIVFESDDFPAEVEFNANLTSIIGSRSSGKSALLAYVAHAADQEHVIEQQLAVTPGAKIQDLGPAAGHTWKSVENLKRKIVWGNPEAATGQVIYVPQNSLYEISTRPGEITSKIRPALQRSYPGLGLSFIEFERERDSNIASLRDSIQDWFTHVKAAREAVKDASTLGDKKALTAAAQEIQDEIDAIRKASSLSESETSTYAGVIQAIATNDSLISSYGAELEMLAPYVAVTATGGINSTELVTVEILTAPSSGFPAAKLASSIAALIESRSTEVLEELRALVNASFEKITSDRRELLEANSLLSTTHADLFQRLKESAVTDELEKRLAGYSATLTAIGEFELKANAENAATSVSLTAVESLLAARKALYARLLTAFGSETRLLPPMEFGMHFGTGVAELEQLALGFNRQSASVYLRAEKQEVALDEVLSDVGGFLVAVETGTQKIRQGEVSEDLAIRVLTAAPEVRLSATLDGDRIGGFATPTMTPGKQALFALTLILSESDEPWPLLLDQPEDDLDSRSIYEAVVPYLLARKKERQIIMVSHNANLVVGADSESVIVANRHGHDRKNSGGRRFDYRSGSLEHSQPLRIHLAVLESKGISEHACEILDGGTDAFEKRKNKYNLKSW